MQFLKRWDNETLYLSLSTEKVLFSLCMEKNWCGAWGSEKAVCENLLLFRLHPPRMTLSVCVQERETVKETESSTKLCKCACVLKRSHVHGENQKAV